jgi:hypothetical protein
MDTTSESSNYLNNLDFYVIEELEMTISIKMSIDTLFIVPRC